MMPDSANIKCLTLCYIVQSALSLERCYKDMLSQGDEVDQRIQLWRDAIAICGISTEAIVDDAVCSLCTLLQLPLDFTSGTLSRLHSSAHMASLKHRLSEALGHRYNHSFQSSDVDERVDLCRYTLEFFTEHCEHAVSVPIMASLGAALTVRFTISAQQVDLQEGFELLSGVVSSTYPPEPQYLADLGEVLARQHMVTGSGDSLNESLVHLRRAYDMRIGHPARGRICRLLASAMCSKNDSAGKSVEVPLDQLIQLGKEILRWLPLGHHSHFEGWDHLAIDFGQKFWRTGDIHDLNRSINYGQIAYAIAHPQYPRAYRFHNNLSNVLKYRYEVLGDSADLELAMVHARRALEIGPLDRRPLLLRALAHLMATAAEDFGDVEMLSEAICIGREALNTVMDSQRFYVLQILGQMLLSRASQSGDSETLIEGIDLMRQSLERLSEGTMIYTDNVLYVARSLLRHYEMDSSRNFHYLTEAIQMLAQLEKTKISDADRPRLLLLKAETHRARFHYLGLPEDLHTALSADEEVLTQRNGGHRLQYLSLAAVSEDLSLFSRLPSPQVVDMGRAVYLQNQALAEISEGHPEHPRMMIALAKLFLLPDTPYTNLSSALSLLAHVLHNPRGNVYRLVTDLIPVLNGIETNIVSKWSNREPIRNQLLGVYQSLIDLLPRLASLDMNLAYRVQVLGRSRDLAVRASSHAMILMQYERAVELLEAGRAILWTQHLRLRTSFDSLDSDVSKELRDIARRLEVDVASSILNKRNANLERDRMERAKTERRHLSRRFDELVNQVRSRPGMDRFLRNMDYKALSVAASRGPVVILLASWLCIIPAPLATPLIVTLDEVTNEWIQTTVNALRQSASHRPMRLNFKVSSQQEHGSQFGADYDVLAQIWSYVVWPLVRALGWEKKEGRDRPRLFVCATGMFSFLPIHAAGYFSHNDKAFHSISEYCIVSYTPTLGGLLSSQQSSLHASRDTNFLLAAAPKPFIFSPLPAAQEEANVVLGIVDPQHLMESVSGDISNHFMKLADEVLQLLPRATILHLACHGFQNPHRPLESGFVMEDKIIQLADLIRLNLPHAHLAVLSACETAQGDMEQPDEALHLAASMLFAGFKSIIGTMWSMGDIDGPVVAETIYRELFAGEEDKIDFDVVPYALDAAVHKLQRQGLEPNRWATYIHIGV